ncbi:hypothetical protein GQ53DRAFT_774954 [Thozetella sp. PMI_491]|nr:hypothetical protein GQ53DRAFT_774954 [Thozetella sp. PMI_491]
MLDVTPTTKPKRLKLPYRRVNKLKDKAEEIVKSFQPLDTTLKYAPRPTGWTDEQVVEESHKGRHFEISTMPRGQLRIVNGNDLKDWEKVGLARAQAEALRAANDDKRRLGTADIANLQMLTGELPFDGCPVPKAKQYPEGVICSRLLGEVNFSKLPILASLPRPVDQVKQIAWVQMVNRREKPTTLCGTMIFIGNSPRSSLDSGEMVNLIDDKVKELVAKMELITKISEHNERMLGVYERRKQKLEAENLLLVAKIAEMKNCGRRQSRVVRRRDFYVIGLPQEPSKVWEPRERSSSDDSWLDTDEDEMLIGAECRAGSSESCAEKTQLRSALEEMRELDLLTFH